MPTTLEQDIQAFNREALQRELTSALIIKHQLQAILRDMKGFYEDEHISNLEAKVMLAVDEILQGMIKAENQETFNLHTKRLRALVSNIREKLSLQDDLDASLDNYRFIRATHRLLLDTDFKDKEQITAKLPEWCKKHDYYETWLKRLTELKAQKADEDFKNCKDNMIRDLVEFETQQNLANLASLSLVDQNIQLLSETRLTYLEESNRRGQMLKDAGWIALGAILVIGSGVLIAFPPLLLAGIIIGAVVLGYGCIDLAKQTTELHHELKNVKIGARQLDTTIEADLRKMAAQLGDFDVEDFLQKQQLKQEGLTREKKLFRGLAFGASAVSLALGVAAFPVLGVLIAAVITLAVISLAIVALVGTMLEIKRSREQKQFKKSQAEIESKMAEDDRLINEANLKEKHQDTLSSTATIIQEELSNSGKSIQNIEQDVKKERVQVQPETVHLFKPVKPVEQSSNEEDEGDGQIPRE